MPRWITVANRLPFSINSQTKKVVTSSGGLVSALSGVKTKGERIWVGCAPDGLSPERWPALSGSLPKGATDWRYHPIFPSKQLYDAYYNGCCNDVFWPLLHYQSELVAFNADTWNAYREMNRIFANEIAKTAREDDLIWIHDFHLFLLPKFLKGIRPSLKTGFFLHVPFPSSEVFRQLPVREEVLDSLLSSDLIGFHDYSYLRHFGSSILRLLGVETELLSVKRNGHTTRLGVFPVSIDSEHFLRRSKEPKIRAIGKAMERNHFLFLGVDRLDYMKGLDLKLKALRTMLRMFPQYKEQVSLLQVAVPTRQGVPVYNRLARDTARLVGEINGEFATPNWQPIHYLHSSVSNENLIGLYRAADALLVSSKRDGMNLVALEFIASQDSDRPGVVLLSEFAGAISNLSHAIAINPWDLEDTARKMQLAMEMPKHEKVSRQLTMQDYLSRYTATDWATSFIAELEKQEPVEIQPGPALIKPNTDEISLVAKKLLESSPSRIALMMDYDGTLVPIKPTPREAILPEQIKTQIKSLTSYPWLDVVVVSGRDSRFLDGQFEGLKIHMAAEHGAKAFDPISNRWQRRIHRSRSSWYPTALKILGDYTARVPHSQIEKKHYSVAWHYRLSPQEYAEFQARKLAEELELGLANLPVSILRGKKVIEVRAIEADKGVFARSFIENSPTGALALAIGDDKTDEDLFIALRGRGYSVKVGMGPSEADYALASQTDVMTFLNLLLPMLDQQMRRKSPSKSVNGGLTATPLLQTPLLQ